MTTIVDLANKQDLDCPKSRVVRKSSFSSSACFAQELHEEELLLVFCSCQVFPLMYALSPEPCLCSPKGRVFMWWMKCFFNVHEDNRALLVLFGVGIDVCLEALTSRRNTSSSKAIVFIC